MENFNDFARAYHHDGRPYFRPERPLHLGQAPGRLDVMGGIADYSGALVLEMPIKEATEAAVQLTETPSLQVVTLSDGRPGGVAAFTISLADLGLPDQPLAYEAAQDYFGREPAAAWAAYVLGALLVLAREKGTRFAQGARLLLRSAVPEGKGVSSSAALEVAAMRAVAAAYGVKVAPTELARLCQHVENRVAGAPCGIMDQMTAVHGRPGQLLALLCQPAEIQGYVAIPPAYGIWGLDSGLRHAVSGADYGSVRVGAFMGLKILQTLSGQSWGGYLANLTPALFAQHYRERLPVSLRGADFLAQYGQLPDTATEVEPERHYAVRQPAAHPIDEHFRVQCFAALLSGAAPENGPLLGELMYQSHASYSACGLGSAGTDLLVHLVREAGPAQGVFGAKITGGGSGGTVAVLGRAGAEAAIGRIAAEYESRTGHSPYIFRPGPAKP